MSDEKLTPERAVRLLRAKVNELEIIAKTAPGKVALTAAPHIIHVSADIALIAGLLADHIEDLIDDGDLPPGDEYHAWQRANEAPTVYSDRTNEHGNVIDYGPQFGEDDDERLTQDQDGYPGGSAT